MGTPDIDTLRGTAGRDVIVTNGAFEVKAGDGDDLICVRGVEAGNIHAGKGADEVHVEIRGEFVWTELGPGADTFHGGTGSDTVFSGDEWHGPDDARDAERDVIFSGRGPDRVLVGAPGAPFLDQVDTGPGADWLTVAATIGDGTGIVDVGSGSDRVDFEWPEAVEGDWLFDNGAQVLTKGGTAQFGWADVESFSLPELAPNPVSFRGSEGSEFVSAGRFERIELRGGRDGFQIATHYLEEEAGPGPVDGGAGRDGFVVDTHEPAVVDLARGRATLDENHLADVLLSGIEDVIAYGAGDHIEIRGNAADNVIRASACDLTVVGAGGNDRIISNRSTPGGYYCSDGDRAVLRGGPGDDLLRGQATPDRLFGGPGGDRMFGRGGSDLANGGDDADTCAAEVRRSCAPR